VTSNNTEDDGPEIRPFSDFLREVARGSVHTEASEQLHALVDAVQETGQKGTLTLAFTVEPIAKGDVSTLKVGGKVVAKLPTSSLTSAFFVDAAGNLSRRDPRQLTLPNITDRTEKNRSTA
jgi:hypothetical protein